MSAKEFFFLVVQVREAQRGYFNTPSSAWKQKQDFLMKSKKLEADLDREIRRIQQAFNEATIKRLNPMFPEFEEFF